VKALLPEWQQSCSEAVRLLAEARDLPPAQMIDVADAALRKTVQARDGMIERLREEPDAPPDWRQALGVVNVALTQIAAVEYPGLLNPEHLDEAKKLLEQLSS